MTNADSGTAARRTQITFINCFDATTFAATVSLTAEEETQLRGLLSALEAYGVLLVPPPADTGGQHDLDGVVAYLRRTVGDHIVEAALGGGKMPDAPGGRPVALMPVWPFEPEGDDPADRNVLLSSGRLWGGDVLIEALQVEREGAPVPALAVRPRFDRWIKAAGGHRDRQVVFPPGEDGAYALFAATAPV